MGWNVLDGAWVGAGDSPAGWLRRLMWTLGSSWLGSLDLGWFRDRRWALKSSRLPKPTLPEHQCLLPGFLFVLEVKFEPWRDSCLPGAYIGGEGAQIRNKKVNEICNVSGSIKCYGREIGRILKELLIPMSRDCFWLGLFPDTCHPCGADFA